MFATYILWTPIYTLIFFRNSVPEHLPNPLTTVSFTRGKSPIYIMSRNYSYERRFFSYFMKENATVFFEYRSIILEVGMSKLARKVAVGM